MTDIKKSSKYNKDNIIDCWTTNIDYPTNLKRVTELEKALRETLEIALKDTIAREIEIGKFEDIIDARIIIDVQRKNYKQLFHPEGLT